MCCALLLTQVDQPFVYQISDKSTSVGSLPKSCWVGAMSCNVAITPPPPSAFVVVSMFNGLGSSRWCALVEAFVGLHTRNAAIRNASLINIWVRPFVSQFALLNGRRHSTFCIALNSTSACL